MDDPNFINKAEQSPPQPTATNSFQRMRADIRIIASALGGSRGVWEAVRGDFTDALSNLLAAHHPVMGATSGMLSAEDTDLDATRQAMSALYRNPVDGPALADAGWLGARLRLYPDRLRLEGSAGIGRDVIGVCDPNPRQRVTNKGFEYQVYLTGFGECCLKVSGNGPRPGSPVVLYVRRMMDARAAIERMVLPLFGVALERRTM